ncbi:MAG: hypothetical protein BroJett022_21410 [Actinomycetes bacterium]|nr:MAG: hypothetical protein BroJett022_21410 [Actinomycetes bacterium]
MTQVVTEGDRNSGIIRIPREAKRLFPAAKARVKVELRGEDIGDRRWDPRAGPDRERSGVLGVGKPAAQGLAVGVRLVVARTKDGVRLR